MSQFKKRKHQTKGLANRDCCCWRFSVFATSKHSLFGISLKEERQIFYSHSSWFIFGAI